MADIFILDHDVDYLKHMEQLFTEKGFSVITFTNSFQLENALNRGVYPEALLINPAINELIIEKVKFSIPFIMAITNKCEHDMERRCALYKNGCADIKEKDATKRIFRATDTALKHKVKIS